MADTRGFSPRNFFSLNGSFMQLHDFEGGVISGEVIKENPDPDGTIRKHLAAIQYEDFIFESNLNNEISALLRNAWKGESQPVTGSLITTDVRSRTIYEDIFQDFQVTETIIPQCDSNSKETAFFGIRIKPGKILNQTGDGKPLIIKTALQQKALLKSNFRFELGKLPCARVRSIDSFNVLINASGKTAGNSTSLAKTNSSIDFPDLFLTISSADLKPWREWHKQFIIEGKNSQADELSGRLIFLGTDMKAELFTINLQGVGIFSLQRTIARAEQISVFRVGLYCERMEIESKM